MTIPILSWNVASSSVLCQFFFDNYFVMSTSSITVQTFNHNNSYIVMGCGKFLSTTPIFFDNIFVMSTSSFTMQSFNHDYSYIVMERGEFLSTMPIFFDNIFVLSTSSLTMHTFNHPIPILSWNVAISSVLCQFDLTIFLSCLQVPLLTRQKYCQKILA